ncbi:hypothetical protein HD554DRAFT_2039978 [Boletus coccyginus]|nr:hypothetical protein HD554DRAFT_2039978 [Boletus coccyginus]
MTALKLQSKYNVRVTVGPVGQRDRNTSVERFISGLMGNDEAYKAVRWVLEVSLFLSAEMIAYGKLPTQSGRLPTYDIEPADWYNNEEGCGRAIRMSIDDSGLQRSDIFYISKLKLNGDKGSAAKAIDKSLVAWATLIRISFIAASRDHRPERGQGEEPIRISNFAVRQFGEGGGLLGKGLPDPVVQSSASSPGKPRVLHKTRRSIRSMDAVSRGDAVRPPPDTVTRREICQGTCSDFVEIFATKGMRGIGFVPLPQIISHKKRITSNTQYMYDFELRNEEVETLDRPDGFRLATNVHFFVAELSLTLTTAALSGGVRQNASEVSGEPPAMAGTTRSVTFVNLTLYLSGLIFDPAVKTFHAYLPHVKRHISPDLSALADSKAKITSIDWILARQMPSECPAHLQTILRVAIDRNAKEMGELPSQKGAMSGWVVFRYAVSVLTWESRKNIPDKTIPLYLYAGNREIFGLEAFRCIAFTRDGGMTVWSTFLLGGFTYGGSPVDIRRAGEEVLLPVLRLSSSVTQRMSSQSQAGLCGRCWQKRPFRSMHIESIHYINQVPATTGDLSLSRGYIEYTISSGSDTVKGVRDRSTNMPITPKYLFAYIRWLKLHSLVDQAPKVQLVSRT